jgi:hypothetical protein
MALIAARTLVLLRGEPLLCRSLVPLLTEALAAAGNPSPVVAAFGTTRPPPASANTANGTSRAVPSGSTFDVLAHALAAIAAEAAVHQHGSPGDLWAYEQVRRGGSAWGLLSKADMSKASGSFHDARIRAISSIDFAMAEESNFCQ